jgi:hypothetical protein
MVTRLDQKRLMRAGEARRVAVSEYGIALRAGRSPDVLDRLAARCRTTCADLTRALAPFVQRAP